MVGLYLGAARWPLGFQAVALKLRISPILWLAKPFIFRNNVWWSKQAQSILNLSIAELCTVWSTDTQKHNMHFVILTSKLHRSSWLLLMRIQKWVEPRWNNASNCMSNLIYLYCSVKIIAFCYCKFHIHLAMQTIRCI